MDYDEIKRIMDSVISDPVDSFQKNVGPTLNKLTGFEKPEEGDDGIRDTISPIDFLPYGSAAKLAIGAGKSLAKPAAQLLGNEIGAIRLAGVEAKPVANQLSNAMNTQSRNRLLARAEQDAVNESYLRGADTAKIPTEGMQNIISKAESITQKPMAMSNPNTVDKAIELQKHTAANPELGEALKQLQEASGDPDILNKLKAAGKFEEIAKMLKNR